MKTEIKTSVEGLAVGMFVSRLDRPWIDTPFLLQGLEIKSRADIEKLREYCNYVYVDVDKGRTPELCFQLPEGTGNQPHAAVGWDRRTAAHARRAEDQRPARERINYTITTDFEDELEAAKRIYVKLRDALEQTISGLKRSGVLDVAQVRKVISLMTDSIIRNPAAMMWVISIRKLDDDSYSRPLGNCVWCATFGRHLGLEPASIEALALGGLLLDIGKARQAEGLLHKNGPLSPREKQQMNMHVYLGVKILEESMRATSAMDIPVEVLNMVATHHERADGSGYPQGLRNDAIPLFGRIAGIVDSYDAMTSRSLYGNGEAMTPHAAITELYELRDRKYQCELIEQFIQAVGLYPTGSLVELTTGEVGAVVSVNGPGRLRPSLVLLLDRSKQALLRYVPMDLSQMSREIAVSRGLAFGAFGIRMDELFQ